MSTSSSGQYFATGPSGARHNNQEALGEEEAVHTPAHTARDDYHWARPDIEKMLQLYLSFWPQMGPRGKYDTLKELFTAIAQQINVSLTSKQVQDKFNRLKKMHKKVKYEDQPGGRKFAYAKYFDQLESMDETFRKEMLTPSGSGFGGRATTGKAAGESAESALAAASAFDDDHHQAAESAAAWQQQAQPSPQQQQAQHRVGGSSSSTSLPPGGGPGEEFYYLDCALSAMRTRKLTPVEGIVLTMKQNSVASKRMLKAYQERTELLKEMAESERRLHEEHFRKWYELKEKELTLQQRRLALEEEKMMIERAKRFRPQ